MPVTALHPSDINLRHAIKLRYRHSSPSFDHTYGFLRRNHYEFKLLIAPHPNLHSRGLQRVKQLPLQYYIFPLVTLISKVLHHYFTLSFTTSSSFPPSTGPFDAIPAETAAGLQAYNALTPVQRILLDRAREVVAERRRVQRRWRTRCYSLRNLRRTSE